MSRNWSAALEQMRALFNGHLGDFGDLVNTVGRINARLERLEEAASTVEHENKGESMTTKDTKRDEQLKAYRAEASEREAPAGLRTERVVLEVTYFGDDSGPPAKWPWQDWVSRLDKGESVRVVSDEERGAEVAKLRSQNELQLKQIAEFASRSGDDLNVVRAERDAAIRELSAEKMWRDNLAMQRNEIRDERDGLKARVASLEAASGNSTAQPNGSQAATVTSFNVSSVSPGADGVGSMAGVPKYGQPQAASEWRILKVGEIVKCGDEMTDDLFMPWCDAAPCIGQEVVRGPVGFRRRIPAQAASGGGEGEPVEDSDAARHLYDTGHRISPFMTLDSHPEQVSLSIKFRSLVEGQAFHGAMVRFFTSPPQPRGWLKSEDRDALRYASQGLREAGGTSNVQAMKQIDALLARSSPPEVVWPERCPPGGIGETWERARDGMWIAALAAAGVAGKEVQ